ncbi:hypothetical protein IAU60_000353 [Kwoniella sp. DSM 27419]
MDSFPIYQDPAGFTYLSETDNQYGEQSLMDSPPIDNHGEEQFYVGDINIQDTYLPGEDSLWESLEDDSAGGWIPYQESQQESSQGGQTTQQVIIGSPFPAEQMKQHFCDLYPEVCQTQGGPPVQTSRSTANDTLEGQFNKGVELDHMDLSGLGLALLLLFLLLLGLNGGWGSQSSDKAEDKKNAAERPQKGQETPEERMLRKTAGQPTQEEEKQRKRREAELARDQDLQQMDDEKRKPNDSTKHGKSSETPEDRRLRKEQEAVAREMEKRAKHEAVDNGDARQREKEKMARQAARQAAAEAEERKQSKQGLADQDWEIQKSKADQNAKKAQEAADKQAQKDAQRLQAQRKTEKAARQEKEAARLAEKNRRDRSKVEDGINRSLDEKHRDMKRTAGNPESTDERKRRKALEKAAKEAEQARKRTRDKERTEHDGGLPQDPRISSHPKKETPEERARRKEREAAKKAEQTKAQPDEQEVAGNKAAEDRRIRKEKEAAERERRKEREAAEKAAEDRRIRKEKEATEKAAAAMNDKVPKGKSETPEERQARKQKEEAAKLSREHNKKTSDQEPGQSKDTTENTDAVASEKETPEQRRARHDAQKAAREMERKKKKGQLDKPVTEQGLDQKDEQDKRDTKNGVPARDQETPEQRAARHDAEKAVREAERRRKLGLKSEPDKSSTGKVEEPKKSRPPGQSTNNPSGGPSDGAEGGEGRATGGRAGGVLSLSLPMLLGLLILLAAMGLVGRDHLGFNSVQSVVPHIPAWRWGGFRPTQSGRLGNGILGEGGGLLGKGGILGQSPLLGIKPTAKVIAGDRGKSAPDLVVNQGKQAEAKTHIHINNANTQGRGIDLTTERKDPTIVTAGLPVIDDPPVLVVEEAIPQPIRETIWEPINFQFTGPANPDRLFNIFLAGCIVLLPLFIDWLMDHPQQKYTLPDYHPPFVQFLALAGFILLALLVADWHFGWTAALAPIAEVSVSGTQEGLTPLIVGAAEVSVSLLWGLEDVLFGEGKVLLGMGLAVLGVVLLSQRPPPTSVPKTDYRPPMVQALCFLGAVLVGSLFWNA